VVLPFVGDYRPFWLGLSTLGADLLLALVVSSLLRHRIGLRSWRAVHWLAYAMWPVALLHGLGTGSDVRQAWMLLLTVACVLVVLAAVVVRVLGGWPDNRRLRAWVLAGAGGFSAFLLAWLPSGPLQSNWARRAGTPSSLLSRASASSPNGQAKR
jgi:methionine sulfoxide reductase heme-binding subunit